MNTTLESTAVDFTTGADPNILPKRLIGSGGYGNVYEVCSRETSLMTSPIAIQYSQRTGRNAYEVGLNVEGLCEEVAPSSLGEPR